LGCATHYSCNAASTFAATEARYTGVRLLRIEVQECGQLFVAAVPAHSGNVKKRILTGIYLSSTSLEFLVI
jgi:hypothetical protein